MLKERAESIAENALNREFPKSCDLKNAISLTLKCVILRTLAGKASLFRLFPASIPLSAICWLFSHIPACKMFLVIVCG